MTEQELKELDIFVNGLGREIKLKKALAYALQYICKANEMGAFTDCAMNGDNAIRYITAVLEEHNND